MSLQITMLKAPDLVTRAESPLSFGEQGGTLGRGVDNTWVLEDPELYLSILHCQFSFENGQYYLTDHSTNGTFYGGSADPMGKGTKTPVYDNDRFVIGDYEFQLAVGKLSSALSPDPFAGQVGGSALPADEVYKTSTRSDDLDGFVSPFAAGHVASKDSLFTAEPSDSDPLAALDKARGGSGPAAIKPGASPDPFAGPTHSDGANSLNQQIDWPEPGLQQGGFAGGIIPDDWDDETVARPTVAEAPNSARAGNSSLPPGPSATPQADHSGIAGAGQAPETRSRQQALEQANAKIQAELDLLKQQSDTRQRGANIENQVDTTFVDALGFANQNLSDAEVSQINQLGGEVLREMIVGLMRVLGSRSSIKNEFRMNVTTIQPVENNPLKFSANVDDALENMFLKQGNAFKKPIESVREGFEGVAEHQVAILAGIREAFKSVIGRFDPVILEEIFSKQNKGGLLPGSQKAKNWEAYLEYYEDLAGDIDKSFQYLFGDGFVRAYEDQLQKLAITRKSRKFNDDTK